MEGQVAETRLQGRFLFRCAWVPPERRTRAAVQIDRHPVKIIRVRHHVRASKGVPFRVHRLPLVGYSVHLAGYRFESDVLHIDVETRVRYRVGQNRRGEQAADDGRSARQAATAAPRKGYRGCAQQCGCCQSRSDASQPVQRRHSQQCTSGCATQVGGIQPSAVQRKTVKEECKYHTGGHKRQHGQGQVQERMRDRQSVSEHDDDDQTCQRCDRSQNRDRRQGCHNR